MIPAFAWRVRGKPQKPIRIAGFCTPQIRNSANPSTVTISINTWSFMAMPLVCSHTVMLETETETTFPSLGLLL
jgi:hypothetical protein